MAFFEVSGLATRFGGAVVNDGVDLSVERGTIAGLIGPNGAGKTTLFNAISGFVPASGRVMLDGTDVLELLPYERAAAGIGRTFQNVRLFGSLTVRENLLAAYHTRARGGIVSGAFHLPPARAADRAARERADEVVRVVDLSPWLDRECGDLSYGTLRLTELACVLMLAPRMLLLDEPASGIAQRETEALAPLLRRIRDRLGATILLIEHDMPLVMGLAEKIFCLDLGRVIAHGTPEEIRSDERVVRAYLGSKAPPGPRRRARAHA